MRRRRRHPPGSFQSGCGALLALGALGRNFRGPPKEKCGVTMPTNTMFGQHGSENAQICGPWSMLSVSVNFTWPLGLPGLSLLGSAEFSKCRNPHPKRLAHPQLQPQERGAVQPQEICNGAWRARPPSAIPADACADRARRPARPQQRRSMTTRCRTEPAALHSTVQRRLNRRMHGRRVRPGAPATATHPTAERCKAELVTPRPTVRRRLDRRAHGRRVQPGRLTAPTRRRAAAPAAHHLGPDSRFSSSGRRR